MTGRSLETPSASGHSRPPGRDGKGRPAAFVARSVQEVRLPAARNSKGEAMSFIIGEFLILLLIAGVCGAVGQLITGMTREGLLVSTALGFVGAVFGAWLARMMDLTEPMPVHVGEATFPVVWSIAGSALFTALLGLLRQPARTQ
jgi:uncharacterized membrane protein YeaQ/YmgE (transglycosylase-associated protein family)